MDLTEEQQQALNLALHPDRPVISITGPAGSGKSTVLATIKQKSPNAAFLAPTNKAATVLRQKGITNAATIHSVLYTPTEVHRHKRDKDNVVVNQKDPNTGDLLLDNNGQPIPEISGTDMAFELRADNLENLPTTAYIDESSMLSEQVLADLHSTFQNVVLIGDKFQLPPVKSKDVFALHPPTIELQTVHRQALLNPILRWVNSIRTTHQMEPETDGHHLQTCNINNSKLYRSLLDNQCQAICFSNKLRHAINASLRQEAALPAEQLKQGEQIVALDNVRLTVEGRPFLKFYNGEILTLAEDSPPGAECNFYNPVNLKFTGGKMHRVYPFWKAGFWQEYDSPAWNNRIFAMRARGELYGRPLIADNAGCLTAHKAQGSEWPNVAVFWQNASLERAMGTLMHRRWLYTAGSRAQERCLVVRC